MTSGRPDVTRLVREAVGVVLPGLDLTFLTEHTTWDEIGADSVDQVEILQITAERLGLPLLGEGWGRTATVRELTERIAEAVARDPVTQTGTPGPGPSGETLR
ncbi:MULTISPECIES: hypothetical protein [unclassified Streptomyces]|uniref:hypothetical protein n=1 Tax=unclassified Streptomyces TaxID=2593676 RepID=UPI00344C7627